MAPIRWQRPPEALEGPEAPSYGGIAGRYLSDPEFARRFYGAHPADCEGDAPCLVAQAVARRTYPRAEVAAILRRQNERWGLADEAARRIDELAREGTLCVFTGQQAGLLTGPLYTIYKALSAVRQAQRLADALGVPVVPIFWLAGDDHDLAEIDHVVVPDADGRPRTCRYRTASLPGARVARQRFGADIVPWLAETLALIADGPGRAEVAAVLSEAYRPGRSWVDACAIALSCWLGRFGLVLVSPDDEDLKRLMAPIFRAEIDDPHVSRRALAERDEAIRAAGYAPQVGHGEAATLVFVDDDAGKRRRVDLVDGGFAWNEGREPVLPAAMEWLLEETPERFSASALLRPVTADTVFPTVMHVMGPGEIAYMAQARALYDRHGVPMPLVAPRASFTVVPPEIARLIEEEGASVADAFQPVDRWFGRLAAEEARARYGAELDACRRSVDAAYDRVDAVVGERLPGLRTAVLSARMKTQAIASRLARKLDQEVRRQSQPRRERLQRIGDAVYPLDDPQERVYPIVPSIARYGLGWLDALLDAIDPRRTAHVILRPAE